MTGSFTRGCGAALCLAALITLAINLFVTPFLPQGAGFAAVASSNAYWLRQSLAAGVALLLVFGTVGLWVSRLGRTGLFEGIAFVIALTGGVALFSIEYSQAFMVRDFALHAPATLNRIMKAPFGPLPLGAGVAVAAFYLGWILLALALLLSRHYSRLSAALVLAGILGAPLLSAWKPFGQFTAVATSLVIGAGWFLLGLQMIRPRGASRERS